MSFIDLRSDTVTKPTPGMLDAMFSAEVGDDVFASDPTVNTLQEKAAALFGMEASLFCPSGTMTNQIAIKAQTSGPGQVIVEETSHTYLYEGGGMAFHSGLTSKLLTGDRGRLTAAQVLAAINPEDDHQPESQLVSLENTCNKGGGSIYRIEDLEGIRQVCVDHHLKLHLDGARLFNAIVQAGTDPKVFGGIFDSISICLSKGLGAPVGSLLLGSTELIRKARRIRKLFGGGMRQAGYLAAAGIYALDHHIERLTEDHEKARKIASALSGLAYVDHVIPPDTNIVIFQLIDSISTEQYLSKLSEAGVEAVPFGPGKIRFVTHLDFDETQLDRLIPILQNLRLP